MKIGLAQVNTTVGNIWGNAEKIIEFQKKAEEAGCELVVYPELAITGYPPRDLAEKKALVRENLEALKAISENCRKAEAVVGFIDRNTSDIGKPIFNAAAVVHRGRVKGIYHKSLLPSYDVFDEGRYFEPGDESLIFEKGNKRFAVTICEDIWSSHAPLKRQIYRNNPLNRLGDVSLDYLINISASPFSLHKEEVRRRIVSEVSGRSRFGVIYLNMVGGNDELIFDGGSFVVDRSGKVTARAASFAEDMVVIDADTGRGDMAEEIEEDTARLAAALVLGLRDYVSKCGFKKVILGLSGGIDSAVTAALSVRALGSENVIGVLMPSPFTSEGSKRDAASLAEKLGIRTYTVPIDNIFDCYLESLKIPFEGKDRDVTEENIQARIRGNLLMAMSNKFGYLVVNTGNKSEMAMGYCTLYGDMTGGLAVLGDVPKTMVYRLGEYLNEKRVIPRDVFTKAPSAELRPGQKDEDKLPPYELLDPILKMYIEENRDPEDIIAAGFSHRLVADIIDQVDRNEYKRRQAPPVLRVTSKAFGIGRRLPIAQNYRHQKDKR